MTPHATRNSLSIGLPAAQYGPARRRLGRICSSCYCFLFGVVSFVGFSRAGLPTRERVRYVRVACPRQSQGHADSRRRLFLCDTDFFGCTGLFLVCRSRSSGRVKELRKIKPPSRYRCSLSFLLYIVCWRQTHFHLPLFQVQFITIQKDA